MRLPNIAMPKGEARVTIAIFVVAALVGIAIALAALSFMEG